MTLLSLVALYLAWTLAVIAAWCAIVGAVLTDTYANWIEREQRKAHARRGAYTRAAMREMNLNAAQRGQ